MHFTRSLLALLSATLAFAADNAFIIPTSGLSATAGQPLALSWTPTTQGTVSLILRSGASSDLASGTTVASSIANSGNYTWNVPIDIERGSDYTIEIVDDSEPSNTNYTPYFVLESSVTTAVSTSEVTLGAPSSTISTSTASQTSNESTNEAAATTTSSGPHTSSATSSASLSSSGSSTMATTTSGSTTRASTASASVATQTGSSGADKLSVAAAGLFGVGALAAFVL
ncbi:hypothetical protein EJ03DRAFT_323739 [Teratosphaeria nubilosa]|uniref:Yeast cell wall synthesis Kre9/Knh1-like N-terminal domain-containing protein n=1 Tax=Teratosphaeria nubilosa TaxID=161662 RepID=A0A6G1LJU6_9PEZI|nr:hypothetical protein EJ03DRAFT_323739 [Teratosphaeria nubilosa]